MYPLKLVCGLQWPRFHGGLGAWHEKGTLLWGCLGAPETRNSEKPKSCGGSVLPGPAWALQTEKWKQFYHLVYKSSPFKKKKKKRMAFR